jgi:hypothetical protein
MTHPGPATQAVVIYESMFGNTAAVAEAVARGLAREGVGVACREVGAVDATEAAAAGLLVLGAPTHTFSLSDTATREDAVRRGARSARTERGLREWLATSSPARPGQVVATFDTRLVALRRLRAAGAEKAADLARRHGFVVVGEPAGFLVEGTQGPLVDGEIERAEAWGARLATCAGVGVTGRIALH